VPFSGISLRIFVGLLVAVIPPILLLVAALLLREGVLQQTSPEVIAIFVILGAIGWAAVLAVVFSRSLAEELRSLVSIAEHGDRGEAEAGAAYRRIAGVLDERNRQLATLAEQASSVRIDDEPRAVVAALTSAVRRVMRDPTWRCVVLASEDHALLPPGVYYGAEDGRKPTPVGDMERWASVTGPEAPTRRIDGPWGAFAVITVAASVRLTALFYAPWEGRAEPTPAEAALQVLVGQHARTALEHSLLYAKARLQAEELNRLSAVQADFLRGVTHDLQTPLTSIGALATELRANELVPPSARADLDTIAHQADRLRRLVGQLLVASRLEARAFVPSQEVFAVRPLVERTWAALRSNRPFDLTVAGPPHLAVGDPDRLEQVLWALLDNAVKYSPDDSPVAVHIGSVDGRVKVEVADRGMGMDAETRRRAFDQFYRAADARRRAPDGSGVGLYAARGLVEAMGGTLEVESQLGVGTRLTIDLPAEPSEDGE